MMSRTPAAIALACFCLCFVSTFLPTTKAEAPVVISSIENGLEFDQNQKLTKHYVVFPANRPDCPTAAWEIGTKRPGYGYTAHPVDGDALAKVFPHHGTGTSYQGAGKDYNLQKDPGDNRCMAACLEKGTDAKLAGYTMPHFHFESEAEADDGDESDSDALQRWFEDECARMEICFVNYAIRERPLEVFWIDPQTGEKVRNNSLDYGEEGTQCFRSFVGHQFEAIDEETGFFQRVTVEHVTSLAFGRNPPTSQEPFSGIDKVEEEIKDTLTIEWDSHKKLKRSFSSLGFAKGRLPDDVFANIAAFYYNNRYNAVSEEWGEGDIYVNWWESDVNFITLPWFTKQRWQLRLMDLVSAWAGVEVEETAMYGLRIYEEGARLLTHVDRVKTHAVSLIVNVAQDNLASPWPVEVFDHGDRLHEIVMEEGDMVYYESAKNLHSRNRPLTCQRGGCRFINLFTHYRPKEDGKRWHWNLSDMPNRPPPLVDGEVAFDTHKSACSRPESGDSDSNSNNRSNPMGIGTVRCDDPRLGNFLSPTLFQARGGEDLFRWWKATADPNLMGFDENDEAIYQEVVYHEHVDENDLSSSDVSSHGQREETPTLSHNEAPTDRPQLSYPELEDIYFPDDDDLDDDLDSLDFDDQQEDYEDEDFDDYEEGFEEEGYVDFEDEGGYEDEDNSDGRVGNDEL